MRKEYYKNDFTCPLRLLDRDGAEVLVGGHDFTAVFVTGSPAAFHPAVRRQTSRYEASRVGGREVNCEVGTDGRVTAVFDNHRLPPGLLQCELTVLVPDGTYPDGTRRDVFTGPVGVLLSLEQVRGGGDPDGCLRLAYAQGVMPVLSHVELVTDKAIYRIPVTGEAVTREEFPPEPSGYGAYYGYGYYGANQPIGLGVWDD